MTTPTNTEKPKHEVTLTVGRNWAQHPRCSCGWTGRATFDKGEAVRTGYAHMAQATR